MKLSVEEILSKFENIRRANRGGVYAPHKPLLVLLALARVQRGEERLAEFVDLDEPLKALLLEFGPSSSAASRHYPFWHLATDGDGAVWELVGPKHILDRAPGATPNLGELRKWHVQGGFPREVDLALRNTPGLVELVAARILESCFPATLHEDIAIALGLGLALYPSGSEQTAVPKKSRDSGFRERVLRAYEYRCCVCGFDLRIGSRAAGLEAAHIKWHQAGGPDEERNGLLLCALHHKLFDLGAFMVHPELRILFSQSAITGHQGTSSELRFHGQKLAEPQAPEYKPAAEFLAWHQKFVFKLPARPAASTVNNK